MADYAKDVLVSTDWVEDHLDDDRIRIVEVDEDRSLYDQAHIPGAIGLDWMQDLQDPVRRRFLQAPEFADLVGDRGISNEHTVVLYGDRNNWFAAYTYWYFRYYGHDAVKLMNGPREKWIDEGRETSNTRPGHQPQQFFVVRTNDSVRALRGRIEAALAIAPKPADLNTRLVDVRSPAEFAGDVVTPAGYEHEGAQRAGHIPGAASVPWASAVNEDGTFKSAEELEALYRSQQVIGNGDPVIAYCRIGERSAHTWFVLSELLGVPDVRNYDGSWTEWGNLIDAPIEIGAASGPG